MSDNVVSANTRAAPAAGNGCLGEAGWLLSGAVLPLGSLTFYRKASQRTVGNAMLFFACFTVALALLSTIGIGISMFSLIGDIQEAYAKGQIPEIIITHGVAEVNGTQPLIFYDKSSDSSGRMLIAVDTSGSLTQIDRSIYTQGMLMTRTELQILNQQGRYQTIPLSQLNSMFGRDPLVLNSATVTQAWATLSLVIVLVLFIFLVLWDTIVRLMFIAAFGLVMWGIVSLIIPKTGFEPVIISGLYAAVPAVYITHLFSRSSLGIPGLQTVLLIIFWSIGLVASLSNDKFFAAGRPLRLWTALLGLPLLLVFIWDTLSQIPAPDGPLILWTVALVTAVVLVGARLYYRTTAATSEPPAA